MNVPILTFPWHAGDDPVFLRNREWLVTNGLGGYASGTLLGVGTRRYHGVFIPNLPAPYGRTVLIPHLDEELCWEHTTIHLAGAEFADGRTEGSIQEVLAEFRHEGQTPVWRMTVNGSLLEKRIIMPYGQNTVYITYTLLHGEPVVLRLRPYVTFRQHGTSLDDPLTQGPFPVTCFRSRYDLHFGEQLPSLRLCVRPQTGVFVAEEREKKSILYRIERNRGYDCLADLQSPGYFSAELAVGNPVALVASVEPWDTLEHDPERVCAAERSRDAKVLAMAPEPARTGFMAKLVLAADQFIILPGSRPEEQALAHTAGEEARTIVAGYHWFTDWGRDTMISLEGLTLCTGRHQEAKAILQTFAHYVKDGLLPNHFPEGERDALYNTVDATFWYFHAVDRYVQYTGDMELVQTLYPTLHDIIMQHQQGTDFGIGMDPHDSLLLAGAEGFALTWMDAKVGDWVVTPRRGKPVEIQALWYNALQLMGHWAQQLGISPTEFHTLAERVYTAFNQRFWFAEGGYLYDVIDGEAGDDSSLRPNQVFTFSLRFPILAPERWRPVLEVVVNKLLTPVGLRTLAQGHSDYKPQYTGDLRARDAAYHQGTVWPWLLGPLVDAWQRVDPDDQRVRSLLLGFEETLYAAGIGTVSEIFDAEPPYNPEGCIAQAWSVAEVLRSLLQLHNGRAR